MPITRLGSLSQSNLQLFRIRNSQVHLAELETQITSGKKSQTYAGLARDVPALLAAENEIARITRFEQNIVTAEERLLLSEANLAGMQDIGEQMRIATNIIPADYDLVAQQAQNYLLLFEDLMNAKDATRALFGGTYTSGPVVEVFAPGDGPVPDPLNPTGQTIFGSPESEAPPSNAGYRFQILATGEDTDTLVQINDVMNVKVQYTATNNTVPPTANQTNAFQEMLLGLVALADLDNATLYPNPDQGDVNVGRDRLTNALQGDPPNYVSFNDMRTSLSVTNKTIDTVKTTFTNVKNLSIDTVHRVEDIDDTEAAIRLRQAMVQLEATYSAVQRISRLTLLDFI